MSRRKPTRRDSAPPCDRPGPDDGIDPRILFREQRHRTRDDRKVLQLCSQAARAIGFALAGACSDPVLQRLGVLAVRPAPDAGRLLVVVGPADDPDEARQVLAHLEAARGLLRSAVASSVHRRRAPDLCFAVVPHGESTT